MHTRSPRFHRLLMLTGLLSLSASWALAQNYLYQYPIDVPFVGATDTYVKGIAQGGTLTGVYRDATGRLRGFMGKPGVLQKVSTRNNPLLEADDINPNLRIVGTYQPKDGGPPRGFSLRGGTFTPLIVTPFHLVSECSVNDVSIIACNFRDHEGASVALFSSAGTVREIVRGAGLGENPFAFTTVALGINNLGDLVGAISTDQPDGESRFTGWAREGTASLNPGWEHLIDAPGCSGDSLIRDLNDHRLMAVTCDWETADDPVSTRSYAFDPLHDVWIVLHVPGAVQTHVTRVNNLGHFVGWYQDADGRDHGFIARPSLIIAQE